MATHEKKEHETGFEEAMAELEEVVRKLEAGDIALEESLRAFERGVSLVRLLHERLDGVQARIEELTRASGEEARQSGARLVLRPFEDEGEDES
ncbi:MAG TPA: exodeoxyribonuclease VII small subunit [Candidatus Limnocylindrales bacterium]|nr:exodeoxyribonuclease VII small subunit [Candidatus Limnocylindrales bacterium]